MLLDLEGEETTIGVVNQPISTTSISVALDRSPISSSHETGGFGSLFVPVWSLQDMFYKTYITLLFRPNKTRSLCRPKQFKGI